MDSDVVLVAILQATFRSNCLSFASLCLVAWDHAITFGQEVEYFWFGEWSISTVLYLTIRYFTLAVSIVNLYEHCIMLSTGTVYSFQLIQRLDQFVYFGYISGFVISLLCQAVVTLRVWYLFSHNRSALAAYGWPKVKRQINSMLAGTEIEFESMWYLLLSSLIVHAVLFTLKIWRVAESKETWRDAPVLRRVVKEGAVVYTFATASLLFTVVGLSQVDNPSVYLSALLGMFSVAVTEVSVCHAMLGIKSLATMWHVDPGWLLNNAELSRVHWRKGRNDGELVVELGGDLEMN